jgi:hypothetical protein
MRHHHQFRSKLSRRREQGYTCVVPLLLLSLSAMPAIATIAQLQNDHATELPEVSSTKRSMLAAAGAATYQSFLLRYPVLATYNDCNHKHVTTNQCLDAGSTKSWHHLSNLLPSAEPPSPETLLPADVAHIRAHTTSDWQTITLTNAKDPAQGQFRLVNYRYQADDPSRGDASTPGTATLIVEGRTDEWLTPVERSLQPTQQAVARLEVQLRIETTSTQTRSIQLHAQTGSNISKH